MNVSALQLNKKTLFVGIGIIALTNSIALSGVAYNRSGEPSSTITLTERELALPYGYGFENENSGISLRFDWRVFNPNIEQRHYGHWTHPEWLDKEKLKALGFDVSYPLDKAGSHRFYQRQLSREVFLVLEYDGPVYQQALARAEQELTREQGLLDQNPADTEIANQVPIAQSFFTQEQESNSRLFAVDAGLNPETLRKQYANKDRYLITRGEVRIDKDGSAKDDYFLAGRIVGLSVAKINVPKQHARLLEPLLKDRGRHRGDRSPRYQVSLNYGQRYEPWVIGISEYVEVDGAN